MQVNFWHLADAGKDSVALLGGLLETYGEGPNYVVVKNHGRGTDFSQLEASTELAAAQALGARVISLPELHEASMRKIDRQDASFWAAINQRGGDDALGMLERQRVKLAEDRVCGLRRSGGVRRCKRGPRWRSFPAWSGPEADVRAPDQRRAW